MTENNWDYYNWRFLVITVVRLIHMVINRLLVTY